jgi:hypothetical protein
MIYHRKTKPLGCLESTNVAKISEAGKWLSFNNLEDPQKTKPLSGLESMGDWKFSEAVICLLFNKLEVGS